MRRFSFVLFTLLFTLPTWAQDSLATRRELSRFTLYAGNPVGLINRLRVMGEIKVSDNKTLLASYTQFYGFVPGNQVSVEMRKYNLLLNAKPRYYYVKAGGGQSYGGGNYVLVGYGIGHQWNLNSTGKFFVQMTEGIKICVPFNGEVDTAPNGFKGLFYLTGPGAIFDFNISIGLRL